MKPFEFDPTIRVVFGSRSVDRAGELAKELGARKVLLVTDSGLISAGHADRAKDSLAKSGLAVTTFSDVHENPDSDLVEKGRVFAKKANADLIVALGGGSAMDTAKGINFVLTNGGSMTDYKGYGKAPKPMLPSIGIPTTAGTGSDAQSFALISDPKTHSKMACGDRKVRFRTAILDPQLCDTAPADVVAASGLDAVSHALESYVSKSRTPFSRMFSREAWRLLAKNLPGVLDGNADVEAWGEMLMAAHLGGLGIEYSMLGAAHACANPLTARFNVTHGFAVSLMLPHVVRFNQPAVNGDYAELADLVPGPSEEDPIGRLVVFLETLLAKARTVTKLRDFGIRKDELTSLAEDATTQWTGTFNPRPLTKNDFKDLYEQAY